MRVSRLNDFALTISADNLICRYDLSVRQLYRKINFLPFDYHDPP